MESQKIITVGRKDVAELFNRIPEELEPGTGVTSFIAQPRGGNWVDRFFALPTQATERADAEQDNTRLQLIPYISLMSKKGDLVSVFVYKRGKGSNESRLHEKYSIGLGGHVDAADASVMVSEDTYDFRTSKDTFIHAMARELKEEVGILLQPQHLHDIATRQLSIASIVYDDTDKVGEVHLGIHFAMWMDGAPVLMGQDGENEVEYGNWVPLNEAIQEPTESTPNTGYLLEKWSKLALAQMASVHNKEMLNHSERVSKEYVSAVEFVKNNMVAADLPEPEVLEVAPLEETCNEVDLEEVSEDAPNEPQH